MDDCYQAYSAVADKEFEDRKGISFVLDSLDHSDQPSKGRQNNKRKRVDGARSGASKRHEVCSDQPAESPPAPTEQQDTTQGLNHRNVESDQSARSPKNTSTHINEIDDANLPSMTPMHTSPLPGHDCQAEWRSSHATSLRQRIGYSSNMTPKASRTIPKTSTDN